MTVNRRERLHELVRTTLAERDAGAFVAVGPASSPGIRYCLSASESDALPERARVRNRHGTVAVAVTTDDVLECGLSTSTGDSSSPTTDHDHDDDRHPAETLASRLAGRDDSRPRTLLTPPTIPHDAALYLERAGFDLASSDLLDRARARKTAGERERIERAQAAASAGLERAAAVLADATVVDGSLAVDGDPLTPERLRVAIDEAIVRAGAFPAGTTSVRSDDGGSGIRADEPLRPGVPITLETSPRESGGYRGGLVRTVVVDGEGGPERRAHVAITHAFRSARALCSTDDPTVEAVSADLEAEIRAFGFSGDDGERIEISVSGVGLDAREAPTSGRIPDGCVLRLEAAVTVDGATVRLADLLVRRDSESAGASASTSANGRASWLEGPSRSLEPSAVR